MVGFFFRRTYLILFLLTLERILIIYILIGMQNHTTNRIFPWVITILTWIVLAASIGLTLVITLMRFFTKEKITRIRDSELY